ncbi:MAG: hypothetical protein L0G36_05575 [Brevibacterium sp.]|nr:hypothetical protein [Brevibacterium sp.]
MGRSLLGPVEALRRWAEINVAAIEDSRDRQQGTGVSPHH